jgi:hypothetical protein
MIIEKLVPNLAIPSATVRGNPHYHRKQIDKPPARSSKKNMLEYPQNHEVLCEQGMRKLISFLFVQKNPPQGESVSQ